MVEELQVGIGADASQFIDETRKASNAFDKFTEAVEDSADTVAKSSGKARDAFGRFVKSAEGGSKKAKKARTAFERLADAAKKSANRIKDLAKRFNEIGVRSLVAGFRGLVSIVSTVTKTVLGLGAALVGIGTAAAVSFAQFQREFSQVRTLVDESVVDIEKLENGVRELSRRFGVDLTDATLAAYQAISAGQDPATVLQFLAKSFEGAAAGAASTAEAVDLFTTVLNAFGKESSETGRISDILFATVREGKTTFSELAASIGQVAPVAASTGVSLEEVGAVVATLTASGLNTAEAITAFKAALVGILKPSKDAAGALARIGVDADSLRQSGFIDAITRVRAAVEAGDAAIVDFFPNVRALVGVSALAGTGFDKLATSIDATTNSAGQASDALAKVGTTTAFAFNKLRKTVEDTFRQIGKAIDPFVSRGISAFVLFANSARKEVEILGDVLARKFAPDVEDSFALLEKAAGESGDLATKALNLIADGFDFVGKQIQRAGPIIAGVVATFETLGDVVKIAANSMRAVFGAALTIVSGAVTAFIGVAESLATALGLDVAGEFTAAREAAEEFTSELANQTKKAAEDTVDAFKDFTDVADVLDDTEKAVRRFGRGVANAAKDVRGLNEEVSEERGLANLRERLDAADKAADDLAESADKAAAGGDKLGEKADEAAKDLDTLDTAATSAGNSIEGLVQAFEKAGRGADGLGDTLKRLAEGVAAIGTAQTADQALAARQEAVEQLIAAADARLESAIGAARTRAQKLNAEAQANLDAAIAAERAAIESRDQPEIEAAGRDVESAQQALEETIKRTNAAFSEQRDVATDAFDKIVQEIAKVDGALEVLRDSSIAKAKSAGRATIAEAKAAFDAEEQRLRTARGRQEISSAAFLQGISDAEQRLAEVIKRTGEAFESARSAAREAFDLGEANEQINMLADALTGEFADSVREAREAAVELGSTQEELNKNLVEIIAQSKAAGEAIEGTGESAEEAKEGFEALAEGAKDAAEQLEKTADAAEGAADRITAAQKRIADQAASFSRTGVGTRPGGETQAGVNERFGAGRSGGFGFGIQRGRGVGRTVSFVDGGPVLQTGRADVEAGEFNLSQRGLSDLGRAFGALLNRGRIESVVNQTNNFQVRSVSPEGAGEDMINELAFKLGPALSRAGRLAASMSPVT